jgi:hypothetical protein
MDKYTELVHTIRFKNDYKSIFNYLNYTTQHFFFYEQHSTIFNWMLAADCDCILEIILNDSSKNTQNVYVVSLILSLVFKKKNLVCLQSVK